MENLFVLALLVSSYVAPTLSRNVKKQLCFSVIGDMGGVPYPPYQTSSQRKVAALLAKVTKQLDCKFVVGVGDNFYFNGVTNVADPRFFLTFESAYSSVDVPWYMIAGNHDHSRNVSAQISYSKVSKKWKYPDFFYSEVHTIPDSNKQLEIVMIDTTMLCWHTRRSGAPTSQIQMNWIEKKLNDSKSDYLIVAGHHPVFSGGAHGNTDCLVQKLKPLLEKYKVTAYFSGHDHNLQHIKENHSDIHYFVSGSGNFVDPRMTNINNLPLGSLKFFHGVLGGFMLVRISNTAMTLRVINDSPKELYKLKLLPRKIKINTSDDEDSNSLSQLKAMYGDSMNITMDTINQLTLNSFEPPLPVLLQSFYINPFLLTDNLRYTTKNSARLRRNTNFNNGSANTRRTIQPTNDLPPTGNVQIINLPNNFRHYETGIKGDDKVNNKLRDMMEMDSSINNPSYGLRKQAIRNYNMNKLYTVINPRNKVSIQSRKLPIVTNYKNSYNNLNSQGNIAYSKISKPTQGSANILGWFFRYQNSNSRIITNAH